MTECWLWATTKDRKGYGQWFAYGRRQRAHRMAYESFVSEIPDGLWVLHKCDVPPCINPDHLFLGTAQDNTQDMIKKGRSGMDKGQFWAKKTHCPHGHEYSPENTYVGNDGSRDCRTCHRTRQSKRKHEEAQG